MRWLVLSLFALGLIVWALLIVPAATSNDGERRAPGTWPKPMEICGTHNRGTIKWVRDQQRGLWIQWKCRCNIGKITVCRWEWIQVVRKLYLRKQLPNGEWYTPPGWHKDLHWVKIKMAYSDGGGFCYYLWPVWHYLPVRLR